MDTGSKLMMMNTAKHRAQTDFFIKIHTVLDNHVPIKININNQKP